MGGSIMTATSPGERASRMLPEELDPSEHKSTATDAGLARLELRIALEEWHRRIPDYEPAADLPVTEYVGAVAGLTALLLRWRP
jgi:hypothetical protein